MQFSLRHDYACSAEQFWNATFFDADYNPRVYREGLEFSRFEVLEQTEVDGVITRTLRVMPKLDAPAPVRKLIGDALVYEEHGRFADGHFVTTIVPSRLADKVSIKSDLWIEPGGEARCTRVVRFDVDVRIFGLGKVFEMFIERTLRENYAKAARWTNDVWLRPG